MPGRFESADQLGRVTPNNKETHGSTKSPEGKSATPSASGFKNVTPEIGQGFKDRGAVNPMGAKSGNPSGFPGV